MDKNIEPYRMSDGRSFTDYRPNHEINTEVKKFLCNSNSQCCKNNYNYKVCLTNGCKTVKTYLDDNKLNN
jgi:hypothetical protein